MSKRKTKAYKAKRQEESTSKVLLKSRIEALQKENYKRLNENPGVKLKLINALLISDYPQLIQQIFGQRELVEILDSNNIELSTNEVVKIASLVLQNNAARSMQFLINSYGMLLGRNEKFIECAAKFLKDKEIINILIKDINFLRNDGKNLLHRAVDMDNLELIQILSELDKSMILQVDDKGFTALHYALAYLNKDLEARSP
jgi:ankyrin repeat protein